MSEHKNKRAAKATAQPTSAPGDFEASIRRLGEIVDTLEQGELPLEESLQLFEEGVRLARGSQKVLDDAEARVEQLLSVDDEGNALSRELAADADE
jgi:exodeoxyribonuclease VII small subunit